MVQLATSLASRPARGALEEVGPRRFDDQHPGVVGREAVLRHQPRSRLASGSSGSEASILATQAGSSSSGSRSGSGK